MSSSLVHAHFAGLAFWAFGWVVLWKTRELNTRPIRPDWRRVWFRTIFGVWLRHIAIFVSMFSLIWAIHELGGFWEVADMKARDRSDILKAKNGDLAAYLEDRQNQLKGILFVLLMYADYLFVKRTQPDGADHRQGPEWSLRLLLVTVVGILLVSLW